jgi:signal transduction histidine kinase
VLPLTLVLIGVAFTGVYSHERAMRALVEERDRALAAVSAAQVRELLRQREAALQSLAAEQAFHHQDRDEQRARLSDSGDMDGLFARDVALLDEAGDLIVAGGETLDWVQDNRVSELARAVMASQDAALTSVFDAAWGQNVFLLGVPVHDETGNVYGVLAGPVSLVSLGLEGLLSGVQVGEHGVVYLVDSAGQILASAASEQPRSSLEGHTGLAVALQDEAAGVTLCHSPGGEQMTLAYAPVDFGPAGWRVLVEQPWREVIGPVLRYSQFMPLVAALAAIVSLLALYYGVRAIARPLQALGQQAERVAWGDFDATRTQVGGVEEIEDLRRTLDQMAQRIRSYQGGMHGYIAAITRGQEDERKRLARELHDDTAQALIALGQRVEMAQREIDNDPEGAARRLAEVRAMLAETVDGVRRFSRDLRPIYLEDLGFIPALEMLAREAGAGEMLSVHFAAAGQVRRLPDDMELAAYRVVQEALNNALQHARPTNVWVDVRFSREDLVLSVRDDGQGFEAPDLPDTLAQQGHFGLMGIQERVLLYGGLLAIHSVPGEGTDITVRLPYPSGS